MVDLTLPFRQATAADGPRLARLVNWAGEGLPLHLWRGLASPNEDPWAVGSARQARRAEEGQVTVVEGPGDTGIIAAMIGYPVPAEPEPASSIPVPLFAPLNELELLVPSTWYLNVLAVYPEARGKGIGARLVRCAEEIAQEANLRGVSIIVADQNSGARRLYDRLGYLERARRPMIKDGWETQSTEWILLAKLVDD